jgi:hypothetical protein
MVFSHFEVAKLPFPTRRHTSGKRSTFELVKQQEQMLSQQESLALNLLFDDLVS